MSPSLHRPIPLVLALLAAVAGAPALAQPDSGSGSTPVTTPDAPVAPAPDSNSAREALKKKEGDVDQSTLLKETLTSAEKQYSLLKSGKLQTTYDLNYTYIGKQSVIVNFDDTTKALTIFRLSNSASHAITNTVEADYGVLDNLTGTFTIPLVSKYSQTDSFSGLTNDFGDLSLGARWQPFSLRREGPTISITGSLRLPTGRSPFVTDANKDLATGQGYASGTIGVNVSKIVDPAAIFGSLNFTLADGANHIHQEDQSGHTLIALKAGPSIGFGGGFAYSLSYDLSTTLSFQETVSLRSHLLFADGTSGNTAQQVSGIFNVGLGIRVSPKTTINTSLGIGLTRDSPDFSLGLNMPFSFGSIL